MKDNDSSNESQDKGFNVKNVGNFTYTTVKGDQNITNILVGENIQSNNPLEPVDKVIGKGITYVSNLIQKRLSS